VNAFGHAVAASWERRDGAFLLGAMLPDLATLVGGRLGRVGEPALAAGLRHHLRVDACFHSLPGFTSWEAEASAGLRQAGLRRHPARAAAHVAIELALDGELAREPAHAGVHERAMRAARERDAPAWRREPSGDWGELIARLSAAGPPRHLREPEAVARRVEAALARRPRLRLAGAEGRALAGWLDAQAPAAGVRAAALADELRRELA
jgi:hypothetical protein